jgi:environmental stress-induced protein Ves
MTGAPLVEGIRLVRFDQVAPQRWRNGGGWTRELLAWPSPQDWRARVSVADIEADGPFSSFPGVQRFFAVLQGAGVELTIDGATRRVGRDDVAVNFAGAAATTCRLLEGPTRDLNLMVRGAHGAMARVAPGRPWRRVTASSCGLFAIAAGRWRGDDASMSVPAYSLLWFERAPAQLAFDAAGWWLAA